MEKINTNFHKNEIPKQYSQCISLLVILIDRICRKYKNYYPQVFLEECEYEKKKKDKKTSKFITDNIDIYPDDSDKEGSHKENSDEEN